MSAQSRLWQLVGLALVAVSLAYGLHAVGKGIETRASRDTVSVTGSATKRIESDFVIWDASVSARAAKPGDAAAQLGRWANAVKAYLTGAGVQASELTVSPISTDLITTDESGNSAKAVYQVTRSFQVRSDRLDQVVTAVEGSTKLVLQGVPLSASPLQYVYTKLADLRPGMTADATKDAINRAHAIVDQTGQKLGNIISIDVSPFELSAPGAVQSDYGGYDTSTRTKDVRAVVNVTFAIE
ncbi:MAG: SIMPL domain-containing protein [Gaiellales bacterium]